jgi:hypothetical protein
VLRTARPHPGILATVVIALLILKVFLIEAAVEISAHIIFGLVITSFVVYT